MNNAYPQHIAFIMDGNGRWAASRALPRTFGHRKGLNRAEKVIQHTMDIGIPYISLYVFSTENWKRPQEEVDTLFKLAEQYIGNFQKFCKDNVRVVFSGDLQPLPDSLKSKMGEVLNLTANNTKITVNLCINYGGRNEVVRAVNQLVAQNKVITEQSVLQSMLNGLPAPDLIVRTGGQMRLSNFMLYEGAYSELYFTDTLWPDFSTKLYDRILDNYTKRVRNFGGLVEVNDK